VGFAGVVLERLPISGELPGRTLEVLIIEPGELVLLHVIGSVPVGTDGFAAGLLAAKSDELRPAHGEAAFRVGSKGNREAFAAAFAALCRVLGDRALAVLFIGFPALLWGEDSQFAKIDHFNFSYELGFDWRRRGKKNSGDPKIPARSASSLEGAHLGRGRSPFDGGWALHGGLIGLPVFSGDFLIGCYGAFGCGEQCVGLHCHLGRELAHPFGPAVETGWGVSILVAKLVGGFRRRVPGLGDFRGIELACSERGRDKRSGDALEVHLGRLFIQGVVEREPGLAECMLMSLLDAFEIGH
jgi:hypothetical protein